METGLPRTDMDEEVMSLHACARERDTVNVASQIVRSSVTAPRCECGRVNVVFSYRQQNAYTLATAVIMLLSACICTPLFAS